MGNLEKCVCVYEYEGQDTCNRVDVNNKLAIVLKPQQSKSNLWQYEHNQSQLDTLLTICMTNYIPSLNKD